MTNQLVPIEVNNQRILTTQQLAEVYETETNNIKNNFANHKTHFVEGVHYFLLKGEELKAFKREVNNIDFANTNAENQVNDIDLVKTEDMNQVNNIDRNHHGDSQLDDAEQIVIAKFLTPTRRGSNSTTWKKHILE